MVTLPSSGQREEAALRALEEEREKEEKRRRQAETKADLDHSLKLKMKKKVTLSNNIFQCTKSMRNS